MKAAVKKIVLVCIFLQVFAGSNIFAQDLHFSQFNEAPVYLNPALCGVSYDMRAIMNYKSQWKSVAVPYKSFGASAEFAMKHKKLNRRSYWTTGFNMYNDVSGDANFSSLHMGLMLGTVLKSGRNGKFSMALTGAFDQRTINGSKLTWDSQYNGYRYDANLQGEQIPNNKFMYGDFGAGFNYHYAKSERYISAADGHRFDIGFSAFHVNVPFYSFYGNTGENLHMKFVHHANFVFALPQIKSNIIPSYIIMMQGAQIEVMAGVMFRYVLEDASVHSGTIKPVALSLGGFYRSRDSFSPQVLFEYDKYGLGVSYDINLSGLTPFSKTRGGLELCLRYNFNPGYGMGIGNTTGPRPTPGKTQSSTGF
jgi:type IX secretion system PorP/SprF family membrane protein